jgi:DNA-binding NarL/FixJ family response regulator
VFSHDDALSAGKGPREPTTVLIVEDDYLVGARMEEALKAAGFTIVGVVTSAEEAIAQAAVSQVSVAVMDVRLAGQSDGVETAIELFGRYGVRSIFATAHNDAEIRKRAEKARPFAWLQKPYSMSSLIDAVREALDSSKR